MRLTRRKGPLALSTLREKYSMAHGSSSVAFSWMTFGSMIAEEVM